MADWISVHHALPEPGEWVLIWHYVPILGDCPLFRPARRALSGWDDDWHWKDNTGVFVPAIHVSHWRRIDSPVDGNEPRESKDND